MELGLNGKVVLIGGASRGLGKAVALGLAQEGAKVAICARERETLFAAKKEIEGSTGSEVLALSVDLASSDGPRLFVAETLNRFGDAHILVTNAGGPPSGPFESFADDAWLKAVDLNLLSAIRLIREVLPTFKKNRAGRIITLTSVAVKEPIDGLILSNAVRAGVTGLAKTLSKELAPFNILVNNICPGYTLTDRVKSLSETLAREKGITPKEIISTWESQIPLKRLGDPKEIAALVVFLASERASYITGATIQVDGGYFKGLM